MENAQKTSVTISLILPKQFVEKLDRQLTSKSNYLPEIHLNQ
jgi:hypothetical protein